MPYMKLWDETSRLQRLSSTHCSELHPIGPEQYIHSGWEHAEAQQLTNTFSRLFGMMVGRLSP